MALLLALKTKPVLKLPEYLEKNVKTKYKCTYSSKLLHLFVDIYSHETLYHTQNLSIEL